MSGLAELMWNLGAHITGSDLTENAQVEHLRQLGIPVFIGHHANNLSPETNIVVYSSAISSQNPEIEEAFRRHIPIIPRAEALADLMRLKRGIAVAGTHGKTTTTSLVASIFIHAKKDPTIAVGGRLDAIKSTSQLGEGEWMIVEADESDGTFTRLSPEIVVITNIDDDHVDHFGSMEKLYSAFLKFASKTPFYGVVVACGDDGRLRELLGSLSRKVIFYGFRDHNDYVLKETEKGTYQVCKTSPKGAEVLGSFCSPIPGDHNALNALASLIVGFNVGISFEKGVEGLQKFSGVGRRFEYKGEHRGILVYDDYGHHPTEIQAVLKAFSKQYPEKDIHVIFQPHRYTRTKQCWNDFLNCFHGAKKVYLIDIYPASELPLENISSERLSKEVVSAETIYCPDETFLFECLKQLRPQKDILLTLGAGNVWRLGEKFLNEST
ncbi:MAG: UDP-N-acetylmuramate--L-alanine ligase [Bdellovibrio sp.]|nr:MAG: UDP-N-acetylmuramate--L-alanine ligase [Bdellovibrio sp.]